MNKLVWSALILVAGAMHVSPARADDLFTVVSEALRRDTDLAQARDEARIADFAVSEARAGLLPRIDGGWGRAYNRISVEGYPNTSYWQNGWTVQLTQPLFDWGKWVDYRQAGTVDARGKVQFAQQEQAAILRAAQAYFDEMAAEDELSRADAYAAAVLAQQEQTTRLHAAREATLIDLHEVQGLLEIAHLQRADARVQLQVKRRALERLTGRPFAPSTRRQPDLAPFTLPRVDPDDVEPWTAQAETKNYLVQLAQIDVRNAELEVEKARAQRYPVVSVSGSHTPAGAASGYSQPSTTTAAMLSITIPIFAGGGIEAQIGKARAGNDKANHALLSAVRDAGAAAQDSYARFRWGLDRVERLTRLAATHRERLDATRIGYRIGSRTSLDVLHALEALYAGRRDLLQAGYDAITAFLELKASTATLGIDDIRAMTAQIETLSASESAAELAKDGRRDSTATAGTRGRRQIVVEGSDNAGSME